MFRYTIQWRLRKAPYSWIVNYNVCYKNDIIVLDAYFIVSSGPYKAFNGTLRYQYTLNDHYSLSTL